MLMNSRMTDRSRHRAGGFSLIEVLVALIVLAIGLLGLAQLQARGLKFNQDAYVRSQATTLAYEIIDRMRANRANASAFVTGDPGLVCDPSDSSINMDLSCWYDNLQATLPGGGATIATRKFTDPVTSAESDYYDIEIKWMDRETDSEKKQTWTMLP